MLRYLEAEEVLLIHHAILEETGGSHGLRDYHLFQSILARPKGTFGGKELYPDIFSKAAVYLEGFACFHVFIDGNKRTAFATAARFLFLNQITFLPTNEEVEKYLIRVATEKPPIADIADWLRQHAKRKKR